MHKIVILLISSILVTSTANGCTGILNQADDGNWVFARTMEFGADILPTELLFIPRKTSYISSLPDNKTGASWSTKYAHVGFGPFGSKILGDGLNEQGLSAGAFYLPGWAEYQTPTEDKTKQIISNIDFISWVLGNFGSVQEVRNALNNTIVTGTILKELGFVPPLHYFIADKTGDRIVVEYIKGQLKIYDTPIGTITNSPSYDWHLTNCRNYIGLSALNRPSVDINGLELAQFGQGSGALGLPGDFTPPSRFIRATFLNQVTLNGKNSNDQITRAFKILNQFDIPLGAVAETINGKKRYEETLWTSVSDMTGLRYYFHTANDRTVRSVDLNTLDLNAKDIQTISIKKPGEIQDISRQFMIDNR